VLHAIDLSETHAVGRLKAVFFKSLGFTEDEVSVLEDSLIDIAGANEVTSQIQTDFGTKYIIEGNLLTPAGPSVRLCTVWIVEHSDPRPRLVTAYPT
jgi:hypothetical protein